MTSYWSSSFVCQMYNELSSAFQSILKLFISVIYSVHHINDTTTIWNCFKRRLKSQINDPI